MKKFSDVDSKTFSNMKKQLTAVYERVSKSSECNDFYNKSGGAYGMKDGDEPIANAILNFIAGEEKFDTNLKVRYLGSSNFFYVQIVGGGN